MPLTVNAPNFWGLTLDNFINKAERVPLPNGDYLFKRDDSDHTKVVPYNGNGSYFPQGSSEISPQRAYNETIDAMDAEASSGIIPYNTAPINQEHNPELLEMVKRWLIKNGK